MLPTGSSAGAGSEVFHVYRHLRRRENIRQDWIRRQAMKVRGNDCVVNTSSVGMLYRKKRIRSLYREWRQTRQSVKRKRQRRERRGTLQSLVDAYIIFILVQINLKMFFNLIWSYSTGSLGWCVHVYVTREYHCSLSCHMCFSLSMYRKKKKQRQQAKKKAKHEGNGEYCYQCVNKNYMCHMDMVYSIIHSQCSVIE